MAEISTTGHSALVCITLRVGGKDFKVAQLGPDFLILKEAATLPPSKGTINLEVDGHPDVFPVNLPQGILPNSRRVMIEEVMQSQFAAA
ncbi:MAG: hypothetical protein U0984_06900 [Prosthecobacter sp.]|nr:hypothetical protein [Prosthecobacter sp.]